MLMLCILFRCFLKLLDTVPYNLIFIVMFIPIPSELIFHLIRVYDAIHCIHIIECMQSSLLVNIVSIYQSLKIWVTVRLLCHFNAVKLILPMLFCLFQKHLFFIFFNTITHIIFMQTTEKQVIHVFSRENPLVRS